MHIAHNKHVGCIECIEYISSDMYDDHIELVMLRALIETLTQQTRVEQQDHKTQLMIAKFEFESLERRFNRHVNLVGWLIAISATAVLDRLVQML